MRKYAIVGSFGLSNLQLVETAKPAPGPGQVSVKIHAVSLNYRDVMMVDGRYNPNQPLPLTPCSDGAGVVEDVGLGVTRVKAGERVCTTFFENWIDGAPNLEVFRQTRGGPVDGTLTECALVNQEGLVRTPAHLSDEEAATLPCAAVTAWTALITRGRLRPGDWVLVQGTGGVSTFALQFAKLTGARVIVTSSSDEKLRLALERGADAVINYRDEPNWGRAAKKITGGRGVDFVVEVGGAGTLAQSLTAVTIGGRIALIGMLGGTTTDINLVHIFRAGLTVHGIWVGHRASFETMNRAIEARQMRPVIDRVFPFADAPAAFQYVLDGRHQGKVVVRVA